MFFVIYKYLYNVAGYDDRGLTSCERYDIQKDFWREVKPITKARTKFGAASWKDGQIFIMGGKYSVSFG